MEENKNELETKTEVVDKKQLKKVNNLNSAFEKLQGSINKAETDKSLNSEEKTSEVVVDYNLDKNELNPKILEENTVTNDDDIKANKKFAWLAYILFFIPLCINKKSEFNRFHANEGLDVFIIDVISVISLLCGKFINFTPAQKIIGHILILVAIALLILTTITKIFQIIQVCRGKKTQTPWLWKTRIIK